MTLIKLSASNLIEKLNQAYYQNNISRPASSIHASSYFNCQLQIWHNVTGTPVTEEIGEPEWEIAAEVGEAIHTVIQKRLVLSGIALLIPAFNTDAGLPEYLKANEAGLQPAIEVPLNQSVLGKEQHDWLKIFGLGGRMDAIVKTADGTPMIFEIKTQADKYFNPRGAFVTYAQEKLVHYELQLQAYLHAYRLPDGKQITEGRVLVYNYENVRQVPQFYKVVYDALRMEKEFERLRAVKAHIDSKTPPAPEPERGCAFCKYRAICK